MHRALSRTAITLALEDSSGRLGHVLVFTHDQTRLLLDDRHCGSEAAIHLAEFEPDVASADHDQVLREEIDAHHGRVRQIGNPIDAGHGAE